MPPEAPVIRAVEEGGFILSVKRGSRGTAAVQRDVAVASRRLSRGHRALGGAAGTPPRQPRRRRYSESEPLPRPISQFGPVHLHAIPQCFWSRHIIATVWCAQGGRVTLWHLE